MNYYYLICFILSAILTAVHIYKWNNRTGLHFSLMYVFSTVANLGYWQLYEATELGQAVLANKITYIGGCFTTLALMFCIFSICKIKVRRWFRILLYFPAFIIYGANLTVGYSDIFYKSVELVENNGRYELVKEYAVFHTLFYVMLGWYLLACVAALIIGLRKKKTVSYKSVYLMIGVMIVNCFAFFGGHFIFDVEYITASYVITEIVFLVITEHLALYNVDEMAVASMLSQEATGAASFDFDYNFLGCNEHARNYFPSFGLLEMDKKPDTEKDNLKLLLFWLEELKSNKNFETIYQHEGKYCKVVGECLYGKNQKLRGYSFIFTDYTVEKQHEEELIRISLTDELTQLHNRRAYEEDIDSVRKLGWNNPLVVVSFDLNGLKRANDSMGHAAGDELLKAAADCLAASLQSVGRVYRTGGDEFMGIFHCTPEELEQSMADLDRRLAEWKGKYVQELSLARGIASQTEFPEYTISQLEKEADRRMYVDKDQYYKRTGIDRRKR